MSEKTNVEKFLELVTEAPSDFLERAEYRLKNRDWLEKSFQIALQANLAMREKGISQKEIAEQLQVSPQQVSEWLKGQENLTLETIVRLENALGIELIEVVGGIKREALQLPLT